MGFRIATREGGVGSLNDLIVAGLMGVDTDWYYAISRCQRGMIWLACYCCNLKTTTSASSI